jgi:hypothetical protein
MKLSREILVQFLVFIVIVLGVYFIFVDFAGLKLNTADASSYLNVAENIATHKGFFTSYNLYESFNTFYHPMWAYMQLLYPLLCVLIFKLHGGIEQVIKLNILILGINSALIFYIIQRLIPTRLNVLFISFLVFSSNFFISALYPWTEQFYFFCFIITFILFLKYAQSPKCLYGLGFLNGILMLIRVAHLYNFLGFLPVLFIGKDPLRQKFNRVFSFVGGFILAYGLYQGFCLISCHVFYPEYARTGMSYAMARLTDGIIYNPDKVGIQVFLGSFFSLKNFLCMERHLRDFYLQMPLFLWPAFVYYFLPIKKRTDGGLVVLCFSQSIFTVLGYSLTFYWLPYHFESLRYSLIPFVLMSVAGWYCLYQGLSFLKPSRKKWIAGLVLLSLLCLQVDKFIVFKSDLLKHPLWEDPYYKDLLEGYHWIDKNLPKEILVASVDDQQGYFMHRPFISMPPGKSFNCTNLSLYNHIYSPDYYLLSSAVTDKCFTSIPHTAIFSNRTFRILRCIKTP